MKTVLATVLALGLGAAAHADFSYTQTQKTTGGMMASMGGANAPQVSKHYFKGQKMKMETAAITTIIDFDAQTITHINNTQKTYSVTGFNDVNAAMKQNDVDVTIDVKDTGQTKTINGFSAHELVMTLDVDSPQMQGRGMGKMQMEVHNWISPDVPGAQELHAFYQRNAEKFPWSALGGGNANTSKAMAGVYKKLASMNGAQVESVVKVKAPGGMGAGAPAGPSAAQMGQMQAGMAQARAQLEAMAAQGGPQGQIAQQQLARMGGMMGGAGGGAGSGSLMEMTIDSSDFSTGSIPDSVFAIPAGYTKEAK
jgi:hypothetical protein